MSGELRNGQFRWTTTPDDDIVIGSPLNAGQKTSKYIVFQVSNRTGFGANPHIRCDWDVNRLNPQTGLPGTWVIRFSNDGSSINDFAYLNLENTFTSKNTFNGQSVFNGTTTFNGDVAFTKAVTVDPTKLQFLGLTPNRVIISAPSSGAIIASGITVVELLTLGGIKGNIQAQLDTKAPLASPALTGIPTAPTAAPGTNTDQLATTAFVQTNSAAVGIKGYDGRSMIINDTVTTQPYRVAIYNGVVSVSPYYLPGADFMLLRDVSTGATAKLNFRNGVLRIDPSTLPGVYSYTLLDYASDTYHRVYLENGTLRNRPE